MAKKICHGKVRAHETKGYEFELIGDCADTVDEIMKNLGPYGQQYLKKRLVFGEEDAGTTSHVDSPSK